MICAICKLTGQRHLPGCANDTQLGRTRPQTNPDTIAKMVREALLRTGDSAMVAASTAASDEACVYLYRMLKV